MFSHVIVGVNDIEASKRFYDALLGTLGSSPASTTTTAWWTATSTARPPAALALPSH